MIEITQRLFFYPRKTWAPSDGTSLMAQHRAILLAAGQGTRLHPLTANAPKCMVEYQGRPIIDYILHALKKANIPEIVIVKGYLNEVLCRDAFTRTYINSRFMETNMVGSLFCAQEELDGKTDVIVSYTDIVYPFKTITRLIESKADFAVIVDREWRKQWESRMENPLLDAETMKIGPDGFITELGKKPNSYDDIQGQYIGLIKISRHQIPKVVEFYHSLDKTKTYDGKNFDNMYMTSFIQLIIDNQIVNVSPIFIDGEWTEIDTPTDLNHTLDLSNFEL